MSASDQLALFEPDATDAARLADGYMRAYRRAIDRADMWHACLCPGLRDACEREASEAWQSWVVCAVFLDLEREAAL